MLDVIGTAVGITGEGGIVVGDQYGDTSSTGLFGQLCQLLLLGLIETAGAIGREV